MKLTFFQIGLGSMGKRRIRNLHALGEKNIIGYDIRPDRMSETRKKYGIATVKSVRELPSGRYDAIIISTPPNTHGQYIRKALGERKHFFVEHPTTDDGYHDIFKHRRLPIVKAPSCTLRFYRPVKMIKKVLDQGTIGKILAFQYHMGQYLPDWHPWEDYRQVYFSKKKTSACREMLPFELIWLSWLMHSTVKEISGSIDKVSDLDMNADDVLAANVKYKNGIIGSLLIDVISRKPFRTLRVLGSTGVLEWERFDSVITVYDRQRQVTKKITVPKGHSETGYVNEEEMYIEEMRSFINGIHGKAAYPFTFEENLLNLKALFKVIKT